MKCGKIHKAMSGLFCANFAHLCKFWAACHQVWCGPCYINHPLDHFQRHIPVDEDGFDWQPQEDTL